MGGKGLVIGVSCSCVGEGIGPVLLRVAQVVTVPLVSLAFNGAGLKEVHGW